MFSNSAAFSSEKFPDFSDKMVVVCLFFSDLLSKRRPGNFVPLQRSREALIFMGKGGHAAIAEQDRGLS